VETKVSVRSDLLKIAEDLKVIMKTANDTSQALSEATKNLGENVDDQVAVVSSGMEKVRKYAKNVAKSLKDDFKGLFAVNAVVSGFKLNEQLSGSIRQAVTLNDTIRNLSPVFGFTQDRAEKFKRSLVQGLAEIGAGSDAAANALAGLAETPVRGEKNLEAYAKTASELAGITKQKGQEGDIAKGLSRVVTAQGGNVNDPKSMQHVADDIVRIRNATGKTATESLSMLEDLFSKTNSGLKSKLASGGGVGLAMAGLIGGQGSTDFLKRYLSLDKFRRSGMEAQGIGKLIGSNGELNTGAFQGTLSEAKRRGSGNAEFGLITMGMSEDEAKGFLRLADALKENGTAIEKARTSVVDINGEYRKTMGLGDAFRANLNKVKGGFSSVMEAIHAPDLINKGTNILEGASQSTAGSAAIVGGGTLLAAMLTSKGLGGVGGLLMGEAKANAVEKITGEHVQRVEVINWPSDFGGGAGAGGAAGTMGVAGSAIGGTAGTVLGGAGAVLAAGTLGYAAGTQANKVIDAKTQGTTAEGFSGNSIERLIFKLEKLFGSESSKSIIKANQMTDVRVRVESKDKSLKAFTPGGRGTSQ
jgi:hypothetical protein